MFKKIIVVLLMCITLVGCGGKVEWPDSDLANAIPVPEKLKGEIVWEKDDELYISLEDYDKKASKEYAEECKKMGYDIDVVSNDSSFEAFNKEGYEVDLSFYGEELNIKVYSPKKYNEIVWPSVGAATLLPAPPSNLGKIEWEYENSILVYISNMDLNAYNKYVDECMKRGFTHDYSRDERYFYADDAVGNHVSIEYKGFNAISIDIDKADEEEKPETNTETQTNTPPAQESTTPSNEIRAEFKEALDSYEAFFDEYIAFMNKYKDSSDPTSMMLDYAKYMGQYADMMGKMDALDDGTLNDAELAYYLEVTSRIASKLLTVN